MSPPGLPVSRPARRACLLAAAAWCLQTSSRAQPAGARPAPPPPPLAHDPFGRIEPPQPALPLVLQGDDGQPMPLRRQLEGRVTAVQLMFTGCSAVCPIQGALFAEVAALMKGPRQQLLSLSIDPLSDDAPALRRWLQRFAATASWRAGVPKLQDLDRLLQALRGRPTGVDRHTGQVFVFDRRARLVFKTPELPPAPYVADLLAAVEARG